MRHCLFVVLPFAVLAGHDGVFMDPNHFKGARSFAGLRYIAETSHALTLVGSDDGTTWWTVQGTCSGATMTDISFDFSSKGGPASLTGTWVVGQDGTVVINWPDGNSWTRLDVPEVASPTVPCISLTALPTVILVLMVFLLIGATVRLTAPRLLQTVEDCILRGYDAQRDSAAPPALVEESEVPAGGRRAFGAV